MRCCEQERRNEHDQLVLDHVKGEALLAPLVKRRNEGQSEN
jgi:hypothetical protein